MNRTVIALCAAIAAFAAAIALADDPAPAELPVVAQTLFSDGTTNTWTQTDLIAALQLINRKYHRDCESPTGRNAWHGKLVSQSVDMNSLTKTETYSDGTTFTFPFEQRTPAQNIAAANARLKTSMTKGVPTALAAARLRREEEKTTTNVVTVTVTAGGDR
mgnify:CR=1 FL=1